MAIANITNNILTDSGVATSSLLTTSAAASTYLALAGGTLTGALSGTSATFSGVVSTTSASSIGFLAQTTANSVYPYFRWVANNRSYWAAAIDSGTDATFKIGGGNTIGTSPFFTIDSGTNASTFSTTFAKEITA